jgi:peptidoglycan/LPS O-acetylase OafA/YrhL
MRLNSYVLNIINSDIYPLEFYQNRGLFPEFIYGILLYYVYKYYREHNLKIKRGIVYIKVFMLIMLSVASYSYMAYSEANEFYIINNRACSKTP